VSEDKISVLIIDDSALMRNLISRLIERDSHLSVVGTAMNGRFGLTKLPRLNPDVIVLDLEMPEMNGIEFLKELQKQDIKTPVVILSSIATKGAKVTMEALALGASDFITKPGGGNKDELDMIGNHLVQLVTVYGNNYRRTKGSAAVTPSSPVILEPLAERPSPSHSKLGNRSIQYPEWEKIKPKCPPEKTEIIAIGISTGGPNALRKVFAELDPNLNLPIVVVQHMPAGFTKEFAASLDRICPLEVKEAEEGDIIKPGRILIAPGDAHIETEKKSLASIIRLKKTELVNGHKPSAGVLFDSIARNYGPNAMAIIMTGMGKDGAREIGEVYKQGGITIAQDQQSCIVYGMPRVAVEHDYIQHIVSLPDMAEKISSLLIK
jgi:two-component system, chemotaxis family, protein-glutamate methylesterase/glutaminase